MEIIQQLDIVGDTTPNNMIQHKYDRAKIICESIWDKPDKFYFEDIFHDTILRCLVTLGDNKLSQDFMKSYFFKAFRINTIRHYGYAYNKQKSDIDMTDIIIPVEINVEGHMDCEEMMKYVNKNYGDEIRNMLWDNLTGIPYTELDKIYKTNTRYTLGKVKDKLKSIYV